MSDKDEVGGEEGKSRPSHLRPVPADGEIISARHMADLESSGIPLDVALEAGLETLTTSEQVAHCLRWKWKGGGGLCFPFRDYDSGKLLSERVKPTTPRTKVARGKTRVIKYEQAPGTGSLPYFPPRTIRDQRLHDADVIVWAEGEKKSIVFDMLGFAVIGITGCHNWNDAEKNRNGDGMVWAPELKKYADRFVKGKHHVLGFDSDALSNEDVMRASRRLAGLLLTCGAETVSLLVIPPDEKDPSRGVGFDDYFVEQGEEAARKLFSEARSLIAPGEELTPIPPKDPLVRLSSIAALRPAKLDKDLRLPPRFEIRRDCSVWMDPPPDKPDAPQREIMRAACFPVRTFHSMDGEEQRMEIAFYAAGKWQKAMIDRLVLRNARKALENMPPGVAIDSNNAAHVVHWFSEYLRHNEARMRSKRFISECGWHHFDERPCFLLDKPITVGPSDVVADEHGGRSDSLEALRPIGNLESHRGALKRFFEGSDVSAIMMLAALAAPLLEPLDAPNFALHLFGESTTGKTTRLKIAGGIYGDPANGTWVGSWNASTTAMEARAAMYSHLPLFFDEVGSGDARAIEKIVYMLVNGEGKSRSNVGLSARKPLSWRDVTISTGEHGITSMSANTGARIRVLQIRSEPFRGMDRAAVDRMRAECDANHGRVGREWIESLVAIEDWGPYRDLFREAKAYFDSTVTDALRQRQSVYFALMAVAEHLSHSFLGIGEEGGATVRRFVQNDTNRTEVQSASDRAADCLSSWIYSDPLSFPRVVYAGAGRVTRTTKGVKKINGARDAKHILFVPGELQERFERFGLSYEEVLSSWREQNHIDCEPKKFTRKQSLNGSRVRFVTVSRALLEIDDVELDGAQTEADFS